MKPKQLSNEALFDIAVGNTIFNQNAFKTFRKRVLKACEVGDPFIVYGKTHALVFLSYSVEYVNPFEESDTDMEMVEGYINAIRNNATHFVPIDELNKRKPDAIYYSIRNERVSEFLAINGFKEGE